MASLCSAYARPVSGTLGARVHPDPAGRPDDWVDALSASGRRHDAACARLHGLLVRGAHHEIRRRRGGLPDVSQGELDDLALQAADDAMVAILAKLPSFPG